MGHQLNNFLRIAGGYTLAQMAKFDVVSKFPFSTKNRHFLMHFST